MPRPLLLLLGLVCLAMPARGAPHHHKRGAGAARYHRAAPRGYAAQIRAWHRRDPARAAPVDAAGQPLLVLDVLNTREQLELDPATPDGAFSAVDLARATHVLRDQQSGDEFPVDPGVLAILYRVQTHFHAPAIRVVSAYRAGRPGSTSRHAQGRAVDVIVPGASDHAVAAFVRDQGFTGVGVYTRSGFVHVDVRARSYFWVDASGPGQRNRARPVRHAEAGRADQHALAQGRTPPRATTLPSADVDRVWRGDAAPHPTHAPDDQSADDDE